MLQKQFFIEMRETFDLRYAAVTLQEKKYIYKSYKCCIGYKQI